MIIVTLKKKKKEEENPCHKIFSLFVRLLIRYFDVHVFNTSLHLRGIRLEFTDQQNSGFMTTYVIEIIIIIIINS